MKVSVLFAICLYLYASIACANAAAPTPVTIKVGAANHTLTFIALPRHTNIIPLLIDEEFQSEHNVPPYEQLNQAMKYDTPLLYLAEKELSIAALRQLTSDSTYNRYQKNILELFGAGDKLESYRAAVNNAEDDNSRRYPACCVDLAITLEICKSLNASAVHTFNDWQDEWEVLTFRLPSRREWQLAALAIDSADQLRNRVHFRNWITFSKIQLADYHSYLEELKMIDQIKDETPSQVEFIDVLSLLYNKNKKRRKGLYKRLGEILKTCHAAEFNIGSLSDNNVRATTGSAPNNRGFHRMYGNVGEWTLIGDSVDECETLWMTFMDSDPNDLRSNTSPFGVIMGGNSINRCGHGTDRWKDYSIAFGKDKSGAPFNVKDAVADMQGKSKTIDDQRPGIRLLLRRALHPQWYVPARRVILKNKDYQQAKNELVKRFNRLCTETEQIDQYNYLELYERLAIARNQSESDWWRDTTTLMNKVVVKLAGNYLQKDRENIKNKTKSNKPSAADAALAALGISENKPDVLTSPDYFSLLTEIDGAQGASTAPKSKADAALEALGIEPE